MDLSDSFVSWIELLDFEWNAIHDSSCRHFPWICERWLHPTLLSPRYGNNEGLFIGFILARLGEIWLIR